MENTFNDQAPTAEHETSQVPEEREEQAAEIVEERPAIPQIPYTAAPTAASVAFPQHAYCTLVTSNDYAPGALVLAHALRNIYGTSRLLACMVTPGLDTQVITRLRQVYHHIHFVDPLDSYDAAALSLLGRPELGITLTKVNVWRLTQYDRVVFLDADTFPLRQMDELFDRDVGDGIAAAADIGWPDCFNSGVFVCRPSLRTYRALLHTMASHGSFDGGDQGLLNTHFSNWSTGDSQSRLPFIYNVTPTAWYR
ncbi:nucleotide-diphospho-sugar transferase [Syncephalis plumigaleata]|nr:nucleotide-diphospho-sugar transferase [Syncephalis plumigaleata]